MSQNPHRHQHHKRSREEDEDEKGRESKKFKPALQEEEKEDSSSSSSDSGPETQSLPSSPSLDTEGIEFKALGSDEIDTLLDFLDAPSPVAPAPAPAPADLSVQDLASLNNYENLANASDEEIENTIEDMNEHIDQLTNIRDNLDEQIENFNSPLAPFLNTKEMLNSTVANIEHELVFFTKKRVFLKLILAAREELAFIYDQPMLNLNFLESMGTHIHDLMVSFVNITLQNCTQ